MAFLHYMLDKLPASSDRAFGEAERGEAAVYLPTIAAAELFYLFEAKKWFDKQGEMRTLIEATPSFRYYPFDKEALFESKKSKAKDIHDKIIIATAKLLKADALITKDAEIRRLGEVTAIW